MKTFILKLIALGVLLGGVWLLALEVGGVTWAWVAEQAASQGYELPEIRLLLLGLATLMVVFGFYGLIPAFKGRAPKRTITFEGEHGDVLIQLDPVQATLTRVLLNMPEIKRVNVRVDPDESGKNALIYADALLQNQPGVSARDTARRVTDYISDSAKSLLGLEDLANIRLNVTGIHLNPKASSKAVRENQDNRPGPPIQIEYTGAAAPGIAPLAEEPIDDAEEDATDNQYHTVDITATPSTESENSEDNTTSAWSGTPEKGDNLPEAEAVAETEAEAADTEHSHGDTADAPAQNLGGFNDQGEEVTSTAFQADDAASENVDAAEAAQALDAEESANEDAGPDPETTQDDDGNDDQPEEKRGWKLFG